MHLQNVIVQCCQLCWQWFLPLSDIVIVAHTIFIWSRVIRHIFDLLLFDQSKQSVKHCLLYVLVLQNRNLVVFLGSLHLGKYLTTYQVTETTLQVFNFLSDSVNMVALVEQSAVVSTIVDEKANNKIEKNPECCSGNGLWSLMGLLVLKMPQNQ